MTRFLCIVGLLSCSVVADDSKGTNRLARESSPYLLQHAHNPVDWYPWGDEAFDRAKRENKLVFLSVGYSACHWCHVMERESFVDPEIARIMNERFVCVKVDREERPDVDQIYMTAIQIISRGGGGWPMSVFILPDGRPFWGGTYFPARTGDRGNATGFLSIMNQVDRAWKEQRPTVIEQSENLTAAIRQSQNRRSTTTIDLTHLLVDSVADGLADQFDPQYGGFGFSENQPSRPKFPEPSNLLFLIDRMRRDSVDRVAREAAKEMLLKSLDGMISGAMIDHLGGGFHRYSVDRRWQIPHFEKMLYDNGQLASVYAEASIDTNRQEYRHVVQGICNFVLRELRSPGGAFYSALDADSEGEEGKYYRWTKNELKSLATSDGFSDFAEVYRLKGRPNFDGEYYALDPGRSVTDVARQRGEDYTNLVARLEPTRKRMFEIRGKRKRPRTDVKILTAWNGLMISGLADAGRILKHQEYTEAATVAADFVVDQLRDDDGRLSRSFASGKATLNAYLDDYAFLAGGLISLHRATGDSRWLELAAEITDKQIELFWDESLGGFYFTSKDHPSLIVRSKDPIDSAIPSGISVSAENLIYLAGETKNETYQVRLNETLKSIASTLDDSPTAAPRAAAVLAEYLDQQSPSP